MLRRRPAAPRTASSTSPIEQDAPAVLAPVVVGSGSTADATLGRVASAVAAHLHELAERVERAQSPHELLALDGHLRALGNEIGWAVRPGREPLLVHFGAIDRAAAALPATPDLELIVEGRDQKGARP